VLLGCVNIGLRSFALFPLLRYGRDLRTRYFKKRCCLAQVQSIVSLLLSSRMACDGSHGFSLWTRLLAATRQSSVGLIENKYPDRRFDFLVYVSISNLIPLWDMLWLNNM